MAKNISINVDLFKRFLKMSIKACKKNEAAYVKSRNYEDALVARIEVDCWEYLLNALDDPSECEFLEASKNGKK